VIIELDYFNAKGLCKVHLILIALRNTLIKADYSNSYE